MDRIVESFLAERDGDLALCKTRGVAYQGDMTQRVDYGSEYFEKYVSYEGTQIALAINAARVSLVRRHYRGPLIDVGVGSGEFLRSYGEGSKGFDVNPVAVEMLRRHGLFSDEFHRHDAFTFWDALEHVEEPEFYFSRIKRGAFVFVSIPVMRDITRVRESRHYRPGEHFYYWTAKGFVDWMALHGFRLLEQNRDETAAGRDSIESFAFVKDLA